jgi:hypothetical protein
MPQQSFQGVRWPNCAGQKYRRTAQRGREGFASIARLRHVGDSAIAYSGTRNVSEQGHCLVGTVEQADRAGC